MALARAGQVLAALIPSDPDQKFGIEILRRATRLPLRQIAKNAGENGAVIFWDFDTQTATDRDLVVAGIIDPTKVVRVALQHAASGVALLIIAEAMERAHHGAPDATSDLDH